MVSAETNGAIPNIAALADPKQARADQRPARFVRVEKAVEIPTRPCARSTPRRSAPRAWG